MGHQLFWEGVKPRKVLIIGGEEGGMCGMRAWNKGAAKNRKRKRKKKIVVRVFIKEAALGDDKLPSMTLRWLAHKELS